MKSTAARAGQSSYNFVVEKISDAVGLIPSKPIFGHKPLSEFERDSDKETNYVLLLPMDSNGSNPQNGSIDTTFTATIFIFQFDQPDATYEQSLNVINEAYLVWEGLRYHLYQINDLITITSFSTSNVYKITNDVLTGVQINLNLLVQDVVNYTSLCDPC